MDFREEIKCTPKKTEKQEIVDAYIEYVNCQGENFLKFIATLNECINIAEKYELVGDTKIKARIKDFDSCSRNTDKKAVDDMFGIEIIPTTERDKEWIMLLTELVFSIGKNQGFNKEDNGYRAYNQIISLKSDITNISEIEKIVNETKIKEVISSNPKRTRMAYKYPELKKQMEEGKNIGLNELEKQAVLEIVNKINNFRDMLNLFETNSYMPLIEMQIKTADVAEQAIRGKARHSEYKFSKKGLTQEEQEIELQKHKERIKALYQNGFLKRGINVPIKFEKINRKIRMQNFEETLLEMWPSLREEIVKDRVDSSNKKAKEYARHLKELPNIFPFLEKYVSVKESEKSPEIIQKLKMLMSNTDINGIEISQIGGKTHE